MDMITHHTDEVKDYKAKAPRQLKVREVDNSTTREREKKSALLYGLGLLSCWAASLGAGVGLGGSLIGIGVGVAISSAIPVLMGVGGVVVFGTAIAVLCRASAILATNIADSFHRKSESTAERTSIQKRLERNMITAPIKK